MPPSYREFPKVTDGWRHAGGFVWLPPGTEQVRRHEDEMGLAEIFEEYLDEDAGPEERVEADIWRRGLQLDVESDATSVLMDPEDVDENGEWAVYTWASWRGAPPERHAPSRGGVGRATAEAAPVARARTVVGPASESGEPSVAHCPAGMRIPNAGYNAVSFSQSNGGEPYDGVQANAPLSDGTDVVGGGYSPQNWCKNGWGESQDEVTADAPIVSGKGRYARFFAGEVQARALCG